MALQGVSLSVELGEVLAVVGSNGAGKSTLIKIWAGADQPSAGSILIEGTPLRASRLSIRIFPSSRPLMLPATSFSVGSVVFSGRWGRYLTRTRCRTRHGHS